MADYLGPIEIPDPPVVSAFPLAGDFGGGIDYDLQVANHVFDQPGLKTEQRFLLGPGYRRFRIFRDHLSCHDYDQLKAHWQQAQGQYAQFPLTVQKPGASETVTARYENPNLQFPHMLALLTGDPGLTLLEVPTITPSYPIAQCVERFPDAALTSALESQVQQFIPLLTITARGQAPLHLANQRVTVGTQLYLARLNAWNGIGQTINETSDSAQFTLGNADDVFVQYANQINLYRAQIQFSLYHVNTGYLIDLWAGYARPWTLTSDGLFVLPASDGVFELTMLYPWRTVSRTCFKQYKGPLCPSTSSETDCPKDFDSCIARGVPRSFGGVVAEPLGLRNKDTDTRVVGFGLSMFTSISVTNDSVYERPVKEVYTDESMKVDCDIAAGRDESEYYSALGIVGEGPIGSYNPNLLYQMLDNQPPHDPIRGGGWRGILGTDPAGPNDYFQLDQAPWTPPLGAPYAAGLAFAEIRRTDAAGLQLAAVTDRSMQVWIDQGISGWTWTAPGARNWTAGLANTVWIAVNVYLRGIGLRVDNTRAGTVSASVMETYFDVNAAIAAAAICDQVVESMLVPGVMEKQFPFRGVLQERKALKDWLTEILNCCLGYYTFVNGKLYIGIRENASAADTAHAFSRDTILWKSLEAEPVSPQFNWLIGEFGDEEFDWATNSVTLYDKDHAEWLGEVSGMPQYLQSTMNFVGVSNKSQCARIITTRLREELGGFGLTEILQARNLKFRTTILALQNLVGDVIGLDHDRLPGAYGKIRIENWNLNPDFSIDIAGSCVTDSMYQYDVGPKPADAHAPAVIPETLPAINGLAWMPNAVAPFPGDPLYPDTRSRTFDLWQDYNIQRDGVWSPAIWVAGEAVVNQFVQQTQAEIVDLELAPGGVISGPCTIYVAVVMTDATGQCSLPSNLYGLWIPSGVVNQKVTLSLVPPAAGTWTGWDLYIGTDRRRIAKQESHTGALPPNYTYSSAIVHMTQQLPEAAAKWVRVSAKHVWHSGVAGVLVTGVTAPNQIQANDFIGSRDPWGGRIVSALADLSDGSAPLWNFTVTAFDQATGTLTVSPDCVRADPADSVQEGDVLIVRTIAQNVDPAGAWIEDPVWHNDVSATQFPGSAGLDPDVEVGRLVRILFGTGAGQIRTIVANPGTNPNTRLYVDPPFETVPDHTSVYIIEARDWDYASLTTPLAVPKPGNSFELRVRVDNLADMVVLVGGFLVDDQGRISDEEFAVYREIYVYGQPPTVRVIGPEAIDADRVDAAGNPDPGPWQVFATDHTIRADTSGTADVQCELMPIAAYAGRTLYFVNDVGPNNLIVTCAPGEALFDGNDTVTVKPLQTMKLTAG